jgi:hypothetical protein
MLAGSRESAWFPYGLSEQQLMPTPMRRGTESTSAGRAVDVEGVTVDNCARHLTLFYGIQGENPPKNQYIDSNAMFDCRLCPIPSLLS